MKKLRFTVLGFLLCAMMLMPTMFAHASTTVSTYYPHGIEDYVDLNNLTCFEIYGNDIYYANTENKVFKYNKTDKTTTDLNIEASSIKDIVVAGNYIFVSTGYDTKVFSLATLSDVTKTVYSPNSHNGINVGYYNGEYYYLYTTSNGSNTILNLHTYKNIEKNEHKELQFVFSNASSYMVGMTDNYIFAKTTTGKTLYLFEQITNVSTTLTPIENNSTGENFFNVLEITDDSTIKSVGMYKNHIFICSDVVMDATYDNNTMEYTKKENMVIDRLVIRNDKFYVFNNTSSDIVEYSYNFNNKTFEKVKSIIASKGSEAGRFKDVSSVSFRAGTLYVSDSGNDRIQIVNKTEVLEPISANNRHISEVVTDKLNNYYYVLTNGNNSYLYKNGTQLTHISGQNIRSIDININDTIYMLADKKIYTYNTKVPKDQNPLNHLNHLVVINQNSKLRINSNFTNINNTLNSVALGSDLYISVDNTLYTLNINTGVTGSSYDLPNNIKDFNFNYFNKLIILDSTGNLIRCGYNDTSDKYFKITGFKNYSCFDIDIVSGEIYIYNTKRSAFEIVKDTEFSPESTFSSYYTDLNVGTGDSFIWKYGTISLGTLIYEKPYYNGNITKIKNSNTTCLVLNANEEFAYIAYIENQTMRTGYIDVTGLANGIQTIGQDGTKFKVRSTNKNVNIYKYPTIYKDVTLSTIDQGTVVTTYSQYPISIDGNQFYIVKIDGQYGYVFAKDVVRNDNISKTIKTNASISIFDNNTTIFVYVEASEDANILLSLPNEYKVNAINYNKNEKFTKINFIDQDGQEREGYVLTKYVKMAGLSPTIITAIILLVLDIIVAVIVIIFFSVYRKKQRAEAEKNDTKKD